MSEQITDRNAAFAAERAQQIQAIRDGRDNAMAAAVKMQQDFSQRVTDGKVRDNGDGTYTVTDPGSWDNGEVWQMQQTPQFGDLVLPVSNLDETTGDAALYTRVPEWHGLGTVVPEGTSDLSEVLRLARIDFEVLQTPVLYRRPGSRIPLTDDTDEDTEESGTPLERARLFGEITEVPGQFVNVRSDTGAPLGVVGKVYKPIQSYDAGRFLQDLIERYSVVFESAGATYGGRHIFIGMRLPDDIELDLGDGVTDKIIPHLYWLGTHDGTGKNRVTVSPWRVACGNTERFNARDAVATWGTRHTTYALSDKRLEEARRTIGLTGKYYTAFKDDEESLARTEIKLPAFAEIALDLARPTGDEDKWTDRQKRTRDEKVDTMSAMFGKYAGEIGRTAYAAERTFSDWLDHASPKRVAADKMAAARATAIIEGVDDEAKNKVHAKLMTLVKR